MQFNTAESQRWMEDAEVLCEEDGQSAAGFVGKLLIEEDSSFLLFFFSLSHLYGDIIESRNIPSQKGPIRITESTLGTSIILFPFISGMWLR